MIYRPHPIRSQNPDLKEIIALRQHRSRQYGPIHIVGRWIIEPPFTKFTGGGTPIDHGSFNR